MDNKELATELLKLATLLVEGNEDYDGSSESEKGELVATQLTNEILDLLAKQLDEKFGPGTGQGINTWNGKIYALMLDVVFDQANID